MNYNSLLTFRPLLHTNRAGVVSVFFGGGGGIHSKQFLKCRRYKLNCNYFFLSLVQFHSDIHDRVHLLATVGARASRARALKRAELRVGCRRAAALSIDSPGIEAWILRFPCLVLLWPPASWFGRTAMRVASSHAIIRRHIK